MSILNRGSPASQASNAGSPAIERPALLVPSPDAQRLIDHYSQLPVSLEDVLFPWPAHDRPIPQRSHYTANGDLAESVQHHLPRPGLANMPSMSRVRSQGLERAAAFDDSFSGAATGFLADGASTSPEPYEHESGFRGASDPSATGFTSSYGYGQVHRALQDPPWHNQSFQQQVETPLLSQLRTEHTRRDNFEHLRPPRDTQRELYGERPSRQSRRAAATSEFHTGPVSFDPCNVSGIGTSTLPVWTRHRHNSSPPAPLLNPFAPLPSRAYNPVYGGHGGQPARQGLTAQTGHETHDQCLRGCASSSRRLQLPPLPSLPPESQMEVGLDDNDYFVQLLCQICLDQRANVALLPCGMSDLPCLTSSCLVSHADKCMQGHVGLCRWCLHHLMHWQRRESISRCPFCRQRVKGSVHLI